ncbi:MAG TPA: NAD(P)H-dependent oxidoreductase [Rhodoblastus sp.]|nr:NAD(P)H-dependent oxidoreductase [Rhodoblastus sp.]
MKCLVALAHPLNDSFCASLARDVCDELRKGGAEVAFVDLYARDFDPRLTGLERKAYYGAADTTGVQTELAELLQAEALVLVFPTWWFGFPAILKGWFDRVWAPGHAYDHSADLGSIRPRLAGLRDVLAITTMGSPAWVDLFVMRRPVRRILKYALLGVCAPRCRFRMATLYRAERLDASQAELFRAKVRGLARGLGRR